MKRFALTGLLLPMAIAAIGATPFDGLAGEQLRRAVADVASQNSVASAAEGATQLFQWLVVTDGDGSKTIKDIFTSSTAELSGSGVETSKMTALRIVDPRWWRSGECDAPAVLYDLVNIRPAAPEVSQLRGLFPPGVVTAPTYDNDIWSVGVASYDGVDINCYQPPRGYEGDFARIYFYMLAAHPAASWLVDSYQFIASSELPCMRPAALRQLLAWHRTDPVDERELARDTSVESLQNHYNPFVRYPDLADYLFGDRLGQAYGESSQTDTDPTPSPTAGTLKPRYSTDELIWLATDMAPADAVWSIDGVVVEVDSVNAADVGVGTHILRFSSSAGSGKLKIVIE